MSGEAIAGYDGLSLTCSPTPLGNPKPVGLSTFVTHECRNLAHSGIRNKWGARKDLRAGSPVDRVPLTVEEQRLTQTRLALEGNCEIPELGNPFRLPS